MAIAGGNIIIRRANLDNGINGVLVWGVCRRKNGGEWVAIAGYDLITSGHFTPHDETIEMSVDVYAFAYPTVVPEDSVIGDYYEYRFTGADSWLGVDEVVRYSSTYTVAPVNAGSSNLSLSLSLMV